MMFLFLLFYLTIYGGAHAYLLVRTVRTFHLSAPFCAVLALAALFMVGAPILVRVLEHHAMELPARLTAQVAYLWMGFFFLFLSASIFLDLARGLLAFACWLAGRRLRFDSGYLLPLSMALALIASLYGLLEAGMTRVERVALKSLKVPKSVGRLRVVQISDVHLGLMVGEKRLAKILDQVTALKPDLILSTGDLLDGQMDGLKGLDAKLAAVTAPLGKYAVLGNHEALAGLAPSVNFTARSGFRLLREEGVVVTDWLALAGVDDPFVARGKEGIPDHLPLERLPRDKYTILLKHRPKVEPQAAALFDLQLSGHVHKGQIFPFNLLTHLVYPLKMGLSQLPSGAYVYVSRGTGTWGPPMRVLAPPEITVIDIFPA